MHTGSLSVSRPQFLIPTNPYHTFYRKKVEDFKEGGGEAAEGKAAAPAKEPEPEPEVVKVIRCAGPASCFSASLVSPCIRRKHRLPALACSPAVVHALVSTRSLAVCLLCRTKDLEKPDPEKYTVHVPEGLSAMDIDVIKLTSQFVARNGRSFLQDLSAKETKNPLFSFLRPTHSLHGFFTALADAYARVLMPPKSVIARLEADMADRTKIMERCLKRLEYDKALDRRVGGSGWLVAHGWSGTRLSPCTCSHACRRPRLPWFTPSLAPALACFY